MQERNCPCHWSAAVSYTHLIDKGEADFILSFELLEAARWTEYLKPGGKIITNTQQVNPMPVITGAASYPQGLVEKMTEAGMDVDAIDAQMCIRDRNIHKVGAIGKPGYLWQARIVDERGRDVAQGEIGELIVNGPGVMLCYYKNPEATAEILKDGWLYTGDMARMDEDGFLYLVDRKKDVVISGGENLYPVQIEDFLRRYDKIKDVAVIGLPDPRLGEMAAAIIEVKEGVTCTEAEINAFCKELPRYKRPRRIIFDKVPRNPTGKIEKPVLREKYCHGRLVEAQTTR